MGDRFRKKINMNSEEVKQLLEKAIDTEEVQVSANGSHYDLLIVSQVFEGLNAVKKQQIVYGVLNENIANGSIHAVNMQTLTPAEWQAA